MSTSQLYWKTRALQGIMFTYMACLHRGEYLDFAFYFCPSFIPDSATFHSYAHMYMYTFQKVIPKK